MEKENPLVNKFLKQISKIIDHKLEKLTTVESAIVDQVNLDGTVNLHIPPDNTIFTNVQNQSIYQDLQVGDCVKVLKQNNKASNMWIIGGHDLKRPKSIEPFKGVDYIIEQGTSGIWTYRKWNSGVAECWGFVTGPTLEKVEIVNYTAFTTALPSGLFITRQCAYYSLGKNAWAMDTVYDNTSNNTIGCSDDNDNIRTTIWWRVNDSSVHDISFYVRVIGTWK